MKTSIKLSIWSGVFTVLVLCGLNPVASHAQVLKNLGRKVERKVEDQANKRIERQIDKAIDKGLDKVEERVENAVKADGSKPDSAVVSRARTGDGGMTMAPFISSGDVEVLDEYEFAIGITYDMTSMDGTKEEKLPGSTLWLSNAHYLGVALDMPEKMFMVMDSIGMITFMENQKRYMAMGADMIGKIGASTTKQDELEQPEYSFERVGSDNILGQSCDIYEVHTEDLQARVWITNSLDVPTGNYGMALSSLMRNSKARIPDPSMETPGIMLKMETKDNNGKRIVMQATAIHDDGKLLQTAEYERLGF